MIEKAPVKKHRPRKEDSVPREYAFKYFIDIPREKQAVCKKAFISIYGISEGRVRRLCNLYSQSLTPHDKRGKHPKANTTPPEVLRKIHDHILSFPRKQTHYSGRTIEYLDARLDIKTMFSLFKSKYPNLNVKYQFYAQYFKDTFSLRFGRPQVDTCIKCEELTVKIKSPHLGEHAKRAAEAELAVHKRRAKKFHNKISEIRHLCQTRDDVAGLTFDFMQNLPLPHIPIQEIFYLRQLWVNCLGIKNLKTKETVFYVFHEGVANKGSNEICSMLLHYIDNFLEGNIQELFLFSDNCPGQNKNHTVIRFLMALTDNKRFRKINHYFPVRGHSFLPNDQDFGVAKRIIKRHDRVFIPDQYYSIMSNASPNFKVFVIQTHQIYNFNKWWPLYYKKKCLSNESFGKKVPREQKQSFTPLSFMSFEYDQNKRGAVVAQEFIDGLQNHTFSLLRNTSNHIVTLPPTEQAYPNNCVPINPKKIENIRQVQPSILDEYKPFYQEILRWPTTNILEEGEDNIEDDNEYDYVP